MTIQLAIIERRADGSEEGRGFCEFISIPGPGDEIFVTRSNCVEQMRVIAVKHYPLDMSKNVQAWINEEPKINLLTELMKIYVDKIESIQECHHDC